MSEQTSDQNESETKAVKTRTVRPKASERNIASELSEPFRPEAERVIVKSGTKLTYLPVAEVITRLNSVLGVGNWSSTIVKCERDQHDPDFVVAHVRIDAVIDGTQVAHEGFGGQKVKRLRSGDIMDLGDEFKGAVSDALKKAAQQFGVGLYLARHDDIIEAEQAAQSAPTIDADVQEKWENLKSFTSKMTSEQLDALNSFWAEHAGGRPKPTVATATADDLDALIGECLRLSLNGQVVE